MIYQTIAAKVQDGTEYVDLMQLGFALGTVVKCSKCDCEYRLFYNPAIPSVETQASEVVSHEIVISNSHPGHPERLRSTTI